MWNTIREELENNSYNEMVSFDEYTYLLLTKNYEGGDFPFSLSSSVNLASIFESLDDTLFDIKKVGYMIFAKDETVIREVMEVIKNSSDILGVSEETSVFISPDSLQDFEDLKVVPCRFHSSEKYSVEVRASYDNMFLPMQNDSKLYVKSEEISFVEMFDLFV